MIFDLNVVTIIPVTETKGELEMELTAYSVKEKAQVPIKNPKIVTMKNGRKAVSGTSPAGNKVFRILGAADAERLEKELGS